MEYQPEIRRFFSLIFCSKSKLCLSTSVPSFHKPNTEKIESQLLGFLNALHEIIYSFRIRSYFLTWQIVISPGITTQKLWFLDTMFVIDQRYHFPDFFKYLPGACSLWHLSTHDILVMMTYKACRKFDNDEWMERASCLLMERIPLSGFKKKIFFLGLKFHWSRA